MSERRFVSLRLLRLGLIVVIALLMAQVIRAPRSGGWTDFVSTVLLRGTAAEEYASVAELANGADLVVVGRIAGIERGRELVAAPEFVNDPVVGDIALVRFALATIEVEQTLTKGVIADPTLEVEILILRWDQVADLQKRLPNGPALFFLHHKEAEADGRYYRLVSVEQGLIGSEGGKAVAPAGDAGAAFLAALDGRDFEDVVKVVDEAIGR